MGRPSPSSSYTSPLRRGDHWATAAIFHGIILHGRNLYENSIESCSRGPIEGRGGGCHFGNGEGRYCLGHASASSNATGVVIVVQVALVATCNHERPSMCLSLRFPIRMMRPRNHFYRVHSETIFGLLVCTNDICCVEANNPTEILRLDLPLRNSIHFINPISTVMIQSGVPYRRSHGIQCKLTVSTRAWRTSECSSTAHQRYGRRRPALNPRAPTRALPSPIDGHHHMKQVGGWRRAPSAERIGTAAATTRGNGSAAALAPAVVISRWGGRRKRPRRGSAAYPTRAARRSSAVLLPPPPPPPLHPPQRGARRPSVRRQC